MRKFLLLCIIVSLSSFANASNHLTHKKNPRMTIIGSGVSGLALAYFLQRADLEVNIIEKRDERFYSERQGFSLTLQANTAKILEEYEMTDEVISLGHRSQEQVFYEKNGEIIYQNDSNDVERFNFPLPRQALRNLFYSKLKPETVKWSMKVVDIEDHRKSGKGYLIKALDKNKNNVSFYSDIIIAADGINSRIRQKYFPEVKLHNLKLCNVYGITQLDSLSSYHRSCFQNKEVQLLDGRHRFFF